MKNLQKLYLSVAFFWIFVQTGNSCAWYDPDMDYFNLFVQELVQENEYYPFLFTLESKYYNGRGNYDNSIKPPFVPNANLESWQAYFDQKLTYDQTQELVFNLPRKHIYDWRKGELTSDFTQKLGKQFYTQYHEGLDYLAYAKYLQPFMLISYVPNDNWYSYPSRDGTEQDASDLDYDEVMKVLTKSYNLTQNNEVKLRYGYQMVRLNHYVRQYEKAVELFKKYVEPIKTDTPIYWYAVEQYAGAIRGLGDVNEANWKYFQVFMHSPNRKEIAYTSITLQDWNDFNDLLERAKTNEEKNFAYFLLAYDNYTNPVPFMDKLVKINPDSDILKVLTVRALDQLERYYLPLYFSCGDKGCKDHKKIPLGRNQMYYGDDSFIPFRDAFTRVVIQARDHSTDEFWDLVLAHIYFLQKDYSRSNKYLPIHTNNPKYKKQANQMMVLNYIVEQPVINATIETEIFNQFPALFQGEIYEDNDEFTADAKQFVNDVLANRYFIQNEKGKSFLMNNKLSQLQYNPNIDLTKSLDQFIQKHNKTPLEKWIVKNKVDMKDASAFFQVIYGDNAIREGNFKKAIQHYDKGSNYSIVRYDTYSEEQGKWITSNWPKGMYDGFNNISDYIFGQEKWVSYSSPVDTTMVKPEFLTFGEFSFIKPKMNKLEFAKALGKLRKLGDKEGLNAYRANTLIGNVLYNTSKLGYFREVLMLDMNNANSPKFHFDNYIFNFQLYYKDYYAYSLITPDKFNLPIAYYQKAMSQTTNKEDKASLLFQMAKAEQGEYYNWEANQQEPNISYSDPNYYEKRQEWEKSLGEVKNKNFRTYFELLKTEYPFTQTVSEYRKSCSYFNYYMKK